jgi:hypothetical protein
MIIFINEDEAYLRWIDQNPCGFVVNANRVPKPNYLILHRSTCNHIATNARENWTTNSYIKICSNSIDELRDWATRDVGGQVQQCGSCNRDNPSVEITNSTAIIQPRNQAAAFPELWRHGQELLSIEEIEPLKASWEKSTDISQVRLREYRQRVRERAIGLIDSDELYLDLHVALKDSRQLLNGNDLENYLTPLFECACLPAETFRLVTASKTVGGTSKLTIGRAVRYDTTQDISGFSHHTISPVVMRSSDTEWKTAIQQSIFDAGPTQLPDGEVEVQIALRCPLSRRNWFRLWKPTGDAMGPILGMYQRKNQFDPKDDRITKLAIHFLPDESLGKAIGVGLWWRLRSTQSLP